MSFRSSDLAIQPKTKARLRMAIKLYPTEMVDERTGISETCVQTPDQLGDWMLNEMIKERYPLVIEMEKEIARVEREMIARGKKQ